MEAIKRIFDIKLTFYWRVKVVFLYVLILSTFSLSSQNIIFSDIALKDRLIENGIDLNSDGEISLSEALNVTDLDISGSNISSLDGIQYFTSLRSINASNNMINSLPDISGLMNLNSIDFNFNQLTEVDFTGLISLKIVYIGINNIQHIEFGNIDSLIWLYCPINMLSGTLDLRQQKGLKFAFVFQNDLDSLLVDSLSFLEELDFSDNNLLDINLLGTSNLKVLRCNNNKLSNLDLSDFKNLTELHCESNNLNTLKVNGAINLEYIFCKINELEELYLDSLFKLITIDCSGNLIRYLKFGEINQMLEWINCNDNNIDTLILSGLPKLNRLDCSKNSIETIELFNLSNLTTLNISQNLIKSLDLSQNQLIENLNCSNNPYLLSLIIKNGVNNALNNFDYSSNPSLRFICVDDNELSVFELKSIAYFYFDIFHTTECVSNVVDNFFFVEANAFFDINNDNCATSDMPVKYSPFELFAQDSTRLAKVFTDEKGSFIIPISNEFFNFTIKPREDLIPYLVNSLPLSSQYVHPNPNELSFCFSKQYLNDLSIRIIVVRPPIPGFEFKISLVLWNKGLLTQNAQAKLKFPKDLIQFISSSTATISSSSEDILVFEDIILNPSDVAYIKINFLANTPFDKFPLSVGDFLTFEAEVIGEDLEANPANNFHKRNVRVIGAYDPNDKTCLQGDFITPEMVGEYVDYVIRFENEGTAPAKNVFIYDRIDTSKLDIESLELIGASHSCKTLITEGNKLQFIFDDINLPFTDPGKDGFVAFKIKTKPHLVLGDTILNKAEIYFDYNLPIETDNAVFRIDEVTSVFNNQQHLSQFDVFPNPSCGSFHVLFKENEFRNKDIQLNIFDLKGTLVYNQNIINQEINFLKIDLKGLPSNNYIISIVSDEYITSKKITIMK